MNKIAIWTLCSLPLFAFPLAAQGGWRSLFAHGCGPHAAHEVVYPEPAAVWYGWGGSVGILPSPHPHPLVLPVPPPADLPRELIRPPRPVNGTGVELGPRLGAHPEHSFTGFRR